MLKLLRLLSFSFLFVMFVSVAQAQQFEVPALTAPVMDQADIVEPQVEEALNNAIRDLFKSSGTQLNVLTVPTLNDVPIEMASIQVTDKWKLGSAKSDKGALLLIAMKERKMRIEVGQGLEGDIPDAIAKRIVDDSVVPLMKAGRTSEAVLVGVASIAQYSDPEFDFASKLGVRERRSQGSGVRGKSGSWFWLLLLLIFIFIQPRGRRSSGVAGALLGYGLGRSHSGWGGGGGFGGGGGGSWGGGGGGFSGGGASGGW